MLRNDYWCKGLGQVQPFSEAYGKFKDIKKKRAEEKKNSVVSEADITE